MPERPESFKKGFDETINLTIRRIGTDNQRFGGFDFFGKFLEIVFNLADIVRDEFLQAKHGLTL